MKVFIAVCITTLVMFPAGYVVAQYWGRPAKKLKELEGKAGKTVDEIIDKVKDWL